MEEVRLSDPDVFPTNEVLESILGESYRVYNEFLREIQGAKINMIGEWRYYKDGKSWLCKTSFKKKTICWLSIWDNYFKLGFYFTEKNRISLMELDIDKQIIAEFTQNKPIGKLWPLTIHMRHQHQIAHVLKLIEFKKSIK